MVDSQRVANLQRLRGRHMEADHLDLDAHDLDDSDYHYSIFGGVKAPTQLRRTLAPFAERSYYC